MGIVEVSDRFTQFYLNRFSGRRLNFQMDKGKADVSVQFSSKCKKILVVSTYQMLVLLLFNNKNTHKFQLNPKYQNPRAKIPIPTLNIKSNKPEIDDKNMEAIYRLRRHQMDAAIVRIMKARKTLKHPDLVTEVVKQLRGRFTPKPVDIKKRIANLIELEYLERDENDRQLYHYKM